MRTSVVVAPNPLTQEQFAKKLGISRKRFLELKVITDRVFNDVVGKRAVEMGLTIPVYLKHIRTAPMSEAATPHTQAALSAPEKRKRKSKGLSSGGTNQASKLN